MKKITVRDSDKQYHTFPGNNVRVERDGDNYEIFSFEQDDDLNNIRVFLGAFYRPMWIKPGEVREQRKPVPDRYPAYDINQDEIPTDFRSTTEDNMDPFTQRALQGRDNEPKPNYNSLAPHTPIQTPIFDHKAGMQFDEGVQVDVIPHGGIVVHPLGTASDRPFDEDTMKAGMEAMDIGDQRKLEDFGPVENEASPVPQESFADLKAKYGTAPADLMQNLEKANAEIVEDMKAAELSVSPPQLDISTAMTDSVMDDERNPDDVIAEAEQRHQNRVKKK